MGYGMGYGMSIFGWLWMFLPWLLLIGLAIWVGITLFPNSTESKRTSESAPEVISDLYARDQISEKQFTEIMKIIKQQNGGV